MTARRLPSYVAKRLALLSLSASLAMLQACGGGGSDGGGSQTPPPGSGTTPPPTTPPTPAVSTYAGGSLTGRLLVNAPDGRSARLMDLASGEQAGLPGSANPSLDVWSVNQAGDTLVRWTRDTSLSAYPVALFEAGSLAARGSARSVSDLLGLGALSLSADGRWALAQYGDDFRADRRLTVLDAQDMSVHKRGSQLDGADVQGEPQAWLPDGRYVYLTSNALWRSAPDASTSERIATLALPPNDDAGTGYVAGKSSLAVSRDGTRIAFTWRVKRGNNTDTHIYTARIDGTELRQMTAVADASSPLNHDFGSPAWSPDGRWLAFVLYMSGTSSAPVWPQAEIGPWRVTGTTGCDASPVYIVSATQAQPRAFTWPSILPDIAVKMRAMGGNTGEWVTSCSTVRWLP